MGTSLPRSGSRSRCSGQDNGAVVALVLRGGSAPAGCIASLGSRSRNHARGEERSAVLLPHCNIVDVSKVYNICVWVSEVYVCVCFCLFVYVSRCVSIYIPIFRSVCKGLPDRDFNFDKR